MCLFDDIDNKNNRLSRFANLLRDLLPSSDSLVMELAAKTVGKLALNSGIYADTYVEFEVKRAFELLAEDGPQSESKKLAAVSYSIFILFRFVNYYSYICARLENIIIFFK